MDISKQLDIREVLPQFDKAVHPVLMEAARRGTLTEGFVRGLAIRIALKQIPEYNGSGQEEK